MITVCRTERSAYQFARHYFKNVNVGVCIGHVFTSHYVFAMPEMLTSPAFIYVKRKSIVKD